MINTLQEARAIVDEASVMELRFRTWTRDVQRDASVGDWQDVTTFVNGWVNFGGASNFNDAQFRFIGNKQVQLRGLIKDGTITSGTVLFTLPEGFRPAHRYIFTNLSGGAVGRVDVEIDGTVITLTPAASNVFLTLDGVIFSLD